MHLAAKSLVEKQRSAALILILLVFANLPHFLFLATIHQRAPIEVNEYLSKIVQSQWKEKNPYTFSVHYLMGCHSCPVHSNLHVPGIIAEVMTLDCSPNCRGSLTDECESDTFQRDPTKFILEKYVNLKEENCKVNSYEGECSITLPDFMVMFKTEAQIVSHLLSDFGFKELSRFSHSINNIFLSNTSIPYPIMEYEEIILFTSLS